MTSIIWYQCSFSNRYPAISEIYLKVGKARFWFAAILKPQMKKLLLHHAPFFAQQFLNSMNFPPSLPGRAAKVRFSLRNFMMRSPVWRTSTSAE